VLDALLDVHEPSDNLIKIRQTFKEGNWEVIITRSISHYVPANNEALPRIPDRQLHVSGSVVPECRLLAAATASLSVRKLALKGLSLIEDSGSRNIRHESSIVCILSFMATL
jgi:hypothetical protein